MRKPLLGIALAFALGMTVAGIISEWEDRAESDLDPVIYA